MRALGVNKDDRRGRGNYAAGSQDILLPVHDTILPEHDSEKSYEQWRPMPTAMRQPAAP